MTWLLGHSLIRFGIVGVCIAALYVCLYLAGLWLGIPKPVANGGAFLIAVAVQYFAQTLFTFRRRARDAGQALRFACIVALGLVTSTLVTSGLAPQLGWPAWLGAAAVTVILPMQNYLLLRFWVFPDPQTGRDTA